MGKKVWCCMHHHIGCPTTPAPPPMPPVVRPPVPAVPLPPVAPPVPPAPVGTTSCPYDCNAGFSNWEKGWPAGKKTYCCQTVHKGCPPTPATVAATTSLPYDWNACVVLLSQRTRLPNNGCTSVSDAGQRGVNQV